MNTMLDASLPLTVGEYLEWGNPNEKPAYDYMKSYSPYDNLEKKAYPSDARENIAQRQSGDVLGAGQICGQAAKMKTDNNVLLFKIKTEPGGHGGASGRYDS